MPDTGNNFMKCLWFCSVLVHLNSCIHFHLTISFENETVLFTLVLSETNLLSLLGDSGKCSFVEIVCIVCCNIMHCVNVL